MQIPIWTTNSLNNFIYLVLQYMRFCFISQISCFDVYQDLLCLAEDGKLHYFDITSGRKLTCIEFLNSETPIKVVSLHQNNLAIGCRSGIIGVIKSGYENILTLDTLTPSVITSICWASTTNFFVATNYGTVSKFELNQVCVRKTSRIKKKDWRIAAALV